MVDAPWMRGRKRPGLQRVGGWFASVAVALAGATSTLDAHAQVRAFDKLVMPGPLASAHAKYEPECGT